MKIFIILVVFILPTVVYNARILGIFQLPVFSHQKPVLNLAKALSTRGHKLTILTTNPMKDKALTNLTEIDVSHLYQALSKRKIVFDKVLSSKNSMWTIMNGIRHAFDLIAIDIFEHKEVQNFLNSNDSFDIVLLGPHDPIFLMLGHKFKANIIGKYKLFTTF